MPKKPGEENQEVSPLKPDEVPTAEARVKELEAELERMKTQNSQAKGAGEIPPVSESTMSGVYEELKGLRADLKASSSPVAPASTRSKWLPF